MKPIAKRVKELRLSRDDFEMLNLIGKGAFGEVSFGNVFVTRFFQQKVRERL